MWKNTDFEVDNLNFQKLCGRMRTIYYLKDLLAEFENDKNFSFKVLDTLFISPDEVRKFIFDNQLDWIIESKEDDVIKSEFKRFDFSEKLKLKLNNFIRNHIPGPLLLEAVFEGEDLGITPPSHLFQSQYIIDFPIDFKSRVEHLSQHIKTMWALSFLNASKKIMKTLHIPVSDWAIGVTIQNFNVPRRGSFYYPDVSAVVWIKDIEHLNGCIVPGCWQPFHPEVSQPVHFIPGKEIPEVSDSLLALQVVRKNYKLIGISKHLAKTHGTQNLIPIKDDVDSLEKYKKRKEARKYFLYGPKSVFSNLSKKLLIRSFELMGEPLVASLTAFPHPNTLEPTVFLNWIKPYTPGYNALPLSFSFYNRNVLLEEHLSINDGSAFASYFLNIKNPLASDELEFLTKNIISLSSAGENFIVKLPNSEVEIYSDLINLHSVVAVLIDKNASEVYRNFVSDKIYVFYDKNTFHNKTFEVFESYIKTDSFDLILYPATIKVTSLNHKATIWF